MELEPILPSPTESKGQTNGLTNAESPAVNTNGEKIVVPQETKSAVSQPQVTQVIPQALPTGIPVATQTQTQAQTTGPAIADDVDVIEKEWVDKAKSIVSSTKDNPHMQEKEVSKLQADYLMKRYGKKMKTVE